MQRKGEMPLPLYHQIYTILREQILDGSFIEDKPIPSELVLAGMYDVSRVTIRATLEKLQKEGLISREKGRGTFPRRRRLTTRPAPADLRGFMDYLVALGWRTRTKILEFEYVRPPRAIARQLVLKEDDVVQKAVRLNSCRGAVYGYVTTYLREDVGRTFTRAQLQKGPMLPLLERAGIRLTRADQTVTAKLAEVRIAKLLETPVGAALVCMRRTIYDQNSAPLEVNEGLYRPDRFEFHLSMERPGGMPESEWSAVHRHPARGSSRGKP